MKHLGLILAFFLAHSVAVAANAEPTTTEQCQNIMQAYGEIQVSAKQAKLTSDIAQAFGQICQKLIEAEKLPTASPKAEPTPEPKKEE